MMYRSSSALAIALLCWLSGCQWYAMNLGNPSQRGKVYKSKISAATGDARERSDCAAGVKGVNSLRGELEVHQTYYGDEIRFWWLLCIQQGLDRLEQPGLEAVKLREAVAKLDLALSMPTKDADLRDVEGNDYTARQYSVASATTLRSELGGKLAAAEEAHRVRLAREAKRIEHGKRAAGRGWNLAALAAWLAVDPIDDAMAAAKTAAIARLRAGAHEDAVVLVAIAPAPTSGASAAVVAAVRAAPGLAGRPELRLVDTPDRARVHAALAMGPFTHDRREDTLAQQWTYVSGTRDVPNPEIARLQKDLAYNEKEAAYWDKKAASINCGGSPKCSATSARDNARRHRERAAKNRDDLARAKPTVRQEVRSVHPYSAARTTVTATSEVTVTLSFAGKRGQPSTGVAKVARVALRYPANPSVKLPSRNDPLPAPAELDAALTTEATRLLATGVARAAALAAGEHDARAAATTDPLERLHYATIRALRSGAAADIEAARQLTVSLFGAALDWAVLDKSLRGL
jgi:hypothetical protein